MPLSSRLELPFIINSHVNTGAITQAELVLVRKHSVPHCQYRHLVAEVGACSQTNCSDNHTTSASHYHMQGPNKVYDVFDITPSFLNWAQTKEASGSEQAAIFVLLMKSNISPKRLFDLNDNANILLVLYENFPPSLRWPVLPPPAESPDRAKRNAPMEPSSNLCRLHSWNFTMADMEWEPWVISPKYVVTNFCSGTCPEPLMHTNLRYTQNALIKSLYRAKFGLQNSSVPSPACCVPIRLAPVSFLVQRNGTVKLINLGEMVATACGCI